MTKTVPSAAIWILDSPETRDISRDLCLRAAQAQTLTVDHQLIDQRPRFGRSRAFNALLQLLSDRAISTVLVASFSELDSVKRTLTIAAFALIVSGTAAFAAAPEAVSKAVASCCQALAACCDGGSCCDEM